MQCLLASVRLEPDDTVASPTTTGRQCFAESGSICRQQLVRSSLMTASGTATLDDGFLPLAFLTILEFWRVRGSSPVPVFPAVPDCRLGWDIVVDLIQQIAGDETANIDATTAEGWYEARFGRSPTYSDVVERLALSPLNGQRCCVGISNRPTKTATPRRLVHRSHIAQSLA